MSKNIFKSHNTNIIKLNTLVKVFFFYLLLILFTATSVYAHDADYGVWHGEQDALILGTIDNIEDAECTVSVSEALPCPKGADFYRMLPLKDIPSSIIVDMNHSKSYYMSYNQKKTFEVGDYVILAVNKSKENWKLTYSPCEVSSLDSNTLEFLPEYKKNSMSAAWEEFVHSKGKVNDFAFHGSDLLVKNQNSEDNNAYKKIFPKEDNYQEYVEENESPKTIFNTKPSSWIKESPLISDYACTIPILLLAFIALILFVRNHSEKQN